MRNFIRNLRKKVALPDVLLQRRQTEQLQALSDCASPFDVPRIFLVSLFSHSARTSARAAHTIHRLMSSVKPREWTQLYPCFKHIHIARFQLPYLAGFPDEIAADLLGVASLNSDGRIRQAAVMQLSKLKSKRKIPYILLRLSDWVPQVRKAAEKAIHQSLRAEYAETFMSYTYLLEGLTRVRRVDLSPVRERIIDFLGSPPLNHKLHRALENADPRIRLFSYRVLLTTRNPDMELVKQCAKDRDPHVRWHIFQQLRNFDPDFRIQCIPLFLSDVSPRVCCAAMRAVSQHDWQKFEQMIFQAIFSNSSSVRRTARFLLGKHGLDDFATEYRKQIDSDMVTPGIISGVAETGGQEDFDTIARFVAHSKSKIRSAAVAGLHKINSQRSESFLVAGLKDPSSKVRQTGCSLLRKSSRFDRAAVKAVLKEASPESRIAALYVLCGRLDWNAIEDIFAAIEDSDETVQTAGWHCCARWYRHRSKRNWLKPSTATLNRVERRIEDFRAREVRAPAFALREWQDLPSLIQSGKQIWGIET